VIAACCITWNRPHELGRLIESFKRQDYPYRFLTILDDAGQYPDQPCGDRWQIISVNRRFRTIGEKRSACVGLTPDHADMLAVFDDDDLYLPWALSSCVAALESAPWAQARVVLEWDGWISSQSWHKQETFNRKDPFRPGYHSAWSFRREAYVAIGGYQSSAHEDWPLAEALLRKFGPSADSTPDGRPWMAYSRGPSHLSTRIQAHHSIGTGRECFARAWDERAGDVIEPVDLYPLIRWDRDYLGIPIPDEIRPRPW
jgi:hypothetical protein